MTQDLGDDGHGAIPEVVRWCAKPYRLKVVCGVKSACGTCVGVWETMKCSLCLSYLCSVYEL